jgi:glutathione S-transferase
MAHSTLYGTPLSLYTGRARSYLIKAGLAYREVIPTTRHFMENVAPKTGGRQSIPTLELPDGSVIRDGVAIIDHFEEEGGHRFSPTSPKQRVLSRLFDVIGAEGLLRPAMHYRWNFPEQNLDFLRFHFQSVMPDSPDRAQKADAAADRMRAACMGFGAVPDTFEMVEALYLELLEKLNEHFSHQPYLLGGKPCVGDFGMIAPLYGHLGRDPKPLSMMQTQAVRLFRWVERMNRPEPDLGEFGALEDSYRAGDEIPATLINVLKHFAIDFIPETRAASIAINEWIDQQDDLAPGTEVVRGVGLCPFEVRGVKVNALAQPFRFYLLGRVQSEYESLGENDRKDVEAMLAASDMTEILDLSLSREIGRDNNLEVWL